MKGLNLFLKETGGLFLLPPRSFLGIRVGLLPRMSASGP